MTPSAGERMSPPARTFTMEPLAQRLRLHQSVEVDQSNPDYIRKKREGELALKHSFDAIISKYENMPESASDIIDMSTGRVVVDNGHLRSIQRHDHTMQAAQFLGGFLEPDRGIDLDDDDDYDELAPLDLPEPPRSRHVDRGQTDGRTAGFRRPTVEQEDGHINTSPANRLAQLAPQTPSAAPMLTPPQGMPFTVPLPQNPLSLLTPEGQSAFILNLNMAMNQFVTNTVANVTNLFGNAAALATMSTPIIQSATTPSILPATVDSIRPGADPKWWFPPLPPRAPRPSLAQSSPIPTVNYERKRRRSFDKPARSTPSKRRATHVVPAIIASSSPSVRVSDAEQGGEGEEVVDISTPEARVSRRFPPRRGPAQKYDFTPEEELYIIEQREVHKTPWAQIRQSRELWKTWPIHAITRHYYECLRFRPRNSVADRYAGWDDEPVNQSSHEPYEQLLTPSSLESDQDAHESPVVDEEPFLAPDAVGSGDELAMPSALPEIPDSQDQESWDDILSSVPPEQFILPSIESEGEDSIHEVEQGRHVDAAEPPTESASPEPVAQRTPKKHGPKRSKTQHQQLPVAIPTEPQAIESIDIPTSADNTDETDETDDELNQSVQSPTPELKREATTPPPVFSALLSTPKSAPQLLLQNSSAARATPRSDRQKRAYNNSVKAMWAKRGKTPTRKLRALKKVKSMQDVLMDDWSEDDLA